MIYEGYVCMDPRWSSTACSRDIGLRLQEADCTSVSVAFIYAHNPQSCNMSL